MILITVMLLFFSLIEHVSSIQCHTCTESGNYCTLPLNFDDGDESNENNVADFGYDSGFFCQSDQFFDPGTGSQKIILRGVQHCKELNIPNHRVHCCRTDHCNKILPPMTVRTLADSMPMSEKFYSSNQRHISSIILITFALILQYFY